MNTQARPPQQPFASPESRAEAPTKARVYFTDGNKKDFFGFYNSGRYAVGEAQKFDYSQNSLIKMIDKWGARVQRAIIYDNQKAGRPEICRKEYGAWSRD